MFGKVRTSYSLVKAHFKYGRCFFVPIIVMCCEDIADRKATNNVEIVCVRIC